MEGPSLVILSEELQEFQGQKVLQVSGNTKQPKEDLKGRTLSQIDCWGKVLFLTFSRKNHPGIVTKTHFMLFGSYRINDPKPNRFPRLELTFKNGTVYFYSCSIKFGTKEILDSYDSRVDVLSPDWDEEHVLKLMGKKRNSYLCDLFLDQSLFAGSGNIVKNEALFNIRRHPLTKLSDIPKKDWPMLIHDVRDYCFNFYEWKKEYQLRKHWQVYRKTNCPICETRLEKKKLGKFERMCFFCPYCQNERRKQEKLVLYDVLPIQTPTEREERFEH